MPKIMPADWRIHPIYLVAVVFGFGLWFDAKWLAPARLGDYQLEIAGSRSVVAKAEAENKRQADRADAAERKAAGLESKILAAERTARDATTANTFISGSPYPIGLESVRIGTTLEEIERKFPEGRIKKEKRYWSIAAPGSVVEEVALYANTTEIKSVVGQLLFWVSSDAAKDPDFLKQKLSHALGTPTEPMPGHYEWRLSDAGGVFFGGEESKLLRNRTYRVVGRGRRPSDWPSPIVTGAVRP